MVAYATGFARDFPRTSLQKRKRAAMRPFSIHCLRLVEFGNELDDALGAMFVRP
jgi:hypothetical protein